MNQLELLQAVAAGEVHQVGQAVQGRIYEHRGEPVPYMDLNMLRKKAWIDVPLRGDPSITPDGAKWLKSKAPPVPEDGGEQVSD